jgi:hypothetical protein
MKRENEYKYTWNKYLSYCERLCPETLSFNMLMLTIPFYEAYKNGVSHRRLMSEIEHVASLDWLTSEQRQERLSNVIQGK